MPNKDLDEQLAALGFETADKEQKNTHHLDLNSTLMQKTRLRVNGFFNTLGKPNDSEIWRDYTTRVGLHLRLSIANELAQRYADNTASGRMKATFNPIRENLTQAKIKAMVAFPISIGIILAEIVHDLHDEDIHLEITPEEVDELGDKPFKELAEEMSSLGQVSYENIRQEMLEFFKIYEGCEYESLEDQAQVYAAAEEIVRRIFATLFSENIKPDTPTRAVIMMVSEMTMFAMKVRIWIDNPTP